MPQPENRAWWSDVQHVRDSIERKREREARRGLRLDARSAARAVAEREEGAPRPGEIPPAVADPREMYAGVHDFMESDDLEWATRPRLVEIDRRRPARRAVERVGPRPDRIALWAVVLGFFLILVAVTSTSHAATRAPSARPSVGHTAHPQVVRTFTATLRANPPAR